MGRVKLIGVESASSMFREPIVCELCQLRSPSSSVPSQDEETVITLREVDSCDSIHRGEEWLGHTPC